MTTKPRTVGAADAALIRQIAKRTEIAWSGGPPREEIIKALTACHAGGCPLDLERLANANPFNLLHDVTGIVRHIDLRTGLLNNLFHPRHAMPHDVKHLRSRKLDTQERVLVFLAVNEGLSVRVTRGLETADFIGGNRDLLPTRGRTTRATVEAMVAAKLLKRGVAARRGSGEMTQFYRLSAYGRRRAQPLVEGVRSRTLRVE